nr:MAG TPA: hypothetical protein [Caudoviricetes sp.]DAR26124.1 MAG TPA: hypothetical protein [Caudoviricetes sp.]
MNQRHSYRIFIFEWLTLHFTKFAVSRKEVEHNGYININH